MSQGAPSEVVLLDERGGRDDVVAVANPVAGADWTYTTTRRATIKCVHAQLNTSAVAGNRVPRLEFLWRGQTECFRSIVSNNITASTGITCMWLPAPYATTIGSVMFGPFVPIELPEQSVIRVVTIALDTADQWQSLAITYRVTD